MSNKSKFIILMGISCMLLAIVGLFYFYNKIKEDSITSGTISNETETVLEIETTTHMIELEKESKVTEVEDTYDLSALQDISMLIPNKEYISVNTVEESNDSVNVENSEIETSISYTPYIDWFLGELGQNNLNIMKDIAEMLLKDEYTSEGRNVYVKSEFASLDETDGQPAYYVIDGVLYLNLKINVIDLDSKVSTEQVKTVGLIYEGIEVKLATK